MVDYNSDIVFYQKDDALVKVLAGITDFPLVPTLHIGDLTVNNPNHILKT